MPAPSWDEFLAVATDSGAEIEFGAKEWSAQCARYEQKRRDASWTPEILAQIWTTFVQGDLLVGLP